MVGACGGSRIPRATLFLLFLNTMMREGGGMFPRLTLCFLNTMVGYIHEMVEAEYTWRFYWWAPIPFLLIGDSFSPCDGW